MHESGHGPGINVSHHNLFEVQFEYLQLRGSHAVADTDKRLRHLITFQVDHVEYVA